MLRLRFMMELSRTKTLTRSGLVSWVKAEITLAARRSKNKREMWVHAVNI